AAEPTYPVAPSATDPKPERPASVPEPVQVTTDDTDHGGLTFMPTGRLLVVAARHESRDDDLVSDVFEFDLDKPDSEAVQLTDGTLGVQGAHVADDGQVYLLASEVGEGNDFVAKHTGLYRLDDSRAVRLTDAETIDLGE